MRVYLSWAHICFYYFINYDGMATVHVFSNLEKCMKRTYFWFSVSLHRFHWYFSLIIYWLIKQWLTDIKWSYKLFYVLESTATCIRRICAFRSDFRAYNFAPAILGRFMSQFWGIFLNYLRECLNLKWQFNYSPFDANLYVQPIDGETTRQW